MSMKPAEAPEVEGILLRIRAVGPVSPAPPSSAIVVQESSGSFPSAPVLYKFHNSVSLLTRKESRMLLNDCFH